MGYFYKTSKILYIFTLLLIFAIIFIFLLVPTSASQKGINPVQSKPESLINNVQSIIEQNKSITSTGRIIYGKSGLGVNLTCDKISPVIPAKAKILMTFEIHGYEDLYPKDGQVLVDIGNSVVKYFSSNRNLLNKCELYVVASANPDGLYHGSTNSGIGRCQVSLGVNINRDFDYNFKIYNDSRDHTLNQPFSAPETKALRDLVDELKPDAVIDCHGWEDDFIGDSGLADCFKNSLHIYRQINFTSDIHGYFSAWAGTQGAKAMLIEYPPEASHNSHIYLSGTIAGLQNLIVKMSR